MEKFKGNKVDFHTHADPLSFESGKKVVDLAKENGVVAVAVFAREQVLPYYDQLIEYGRGLGVEVITGIESLTLVGGHPVQIVGLGFDHSRLMESKSVPQVEANIRMASLQKEFLEQKGFVVGKDLSEDKSQLLRSVLKGEITEKAVRLCEIAVFEKDNKVLVDKLIAENIDLWKKINMKYFEYYKDDMQKMRTKLLYLIYFDVDREGFNYVINSYQRPIPTISSQIDELHKAGGVALYSPEGDFDMEIWEYLKSCKIDGMMAWHAHHLGFNGGEIDIPSRIIRECVKDNMLLLGGSDHTAGGDWKVGEGRDKRLYVNVRRFTKLINKLATIPVVK